MTSDCSATLRGVAYRVPLATAALVVGGFTLAGLPLTASFFPHWLLLRDLAQIDPRWVWLLVGSGLGVAVGYLRGLNAMLAPPADSASANVSRRAWMAMVFLVALGLFSLGLSLFPDPLLMVVDRLLLAYPLPLL